MGAVSLIFIIENQTYIQSGAFNSVMGMEVLLIFCKEPCNGKILNFNNELGGESFLSAIALMEAYFVITLNIIHYNPYNTLRAEQSLQQIINRPESELISMENREQPSVLEQLFYMIYHLTAFIYKNSFISLIIVMMVSKILYINTYVAQISFSGQVRFAENHIQFINFYFFYFRRGP